MPTSRPPAFDDFGAYVPVDHRDPDEVIVNAVSERLAAADALTTSGTEELLFVTFRSRRHRIPLTNSYHDRYVTISSLAELLKEHYRFFLFVPSLGNDTHQLLVAPVDEAQTWSSLPQHLTELQSGVDYFAGMKVPYLNHEDSAPNFARDSRRFLETKAAQERFILSALQEKKVDVAMCAGLAKLVTSDPDLRAQAGLTPDASEEEISSAIYEMLCAFLDDPDKGQAFRNFHAAIRMVEGLTGGRWPIPGEV